MVTSQNTVTRLTLDHQPPHQESISYTGRAKKKKPIFTLLCLIASVTLHRGAYRPVGRLEYDTCFIGTRRRCADNVDRLNAPKSEAKQSGATFRSRQSVEVNIIRLQIVACVILVAFIGWHSYRAPTHVSFRQFQPPLLLLSLSPQVAPIYLVVPTALKPINLIMDHSIKLNNGPWLSWLMWIHAFNRIRWRGCLSKKDGTQETV